MRNKFKKENKMSKSQDNKKGTKKVALLSKKEKKAAKQDKKNGLSNHELIPK